MSLLRLGVGKKRASAVVQIAFGAKTRSGHGGVPLGVAAGAAITGEENTAYWGIMGIVLILLAGLLVLIPVKEPADHAVD